MFNIGGFEMLVIGVVALIVVGPKDLPNLFRSAGQAMGRVRAMADDFRRTMEAAADDAGVNEFKRDFSNLDKDVKEIGQGDPLGVKETNEKLRELDRKKVDDINESAEALEAELNAETRAAAKPAAKAKAPRKAAAKSTATKSTKSAAPTPKKKATASTAKSTARKASASGASQNANASKAKPTAKPATKRKTTANSKTKTTSNKETTE